MSNFEVGDRVVVVDDVIGRGYWTCRRGSIVLVTEGSLPVRVVFDGGGTARFNPDELELEGVYDALSKKPVEESSFADSKVDSSGDDSVSHPSHYTSHPSGIECIQVTEHMDFLTGSIIKYLWRKDFKYETPLEDLKKARFYLNRLIAREEGQLGGSVE